MSLLFCAVLSGCGGNTEPGPIDGTGDTPGVNGGGASQLNAVPVADVVVTNEVLRQMAEQLGGEKLSVRKIVPETTSSRVWRPRRADVQALKAARLILMNGAGYEPWKDRVSLPGSRVTTTTSGCTSQILSIPDAVTHQHGPDGAHSHAGDVWTTWLDPELAIAQLSQVEQAIVRLQPDDKTNIARESGRIRTSLEDLDAQIEALKNATSSQSLSVVSDSAAVMYLTNRLGWQLTYLHWENSMAPTEVDRLELAELCDAWSKNQKPGGQKPGGQAEGQKAKGQKAEGQKPQIALLNDRCPPSAIQWFQDAGFLIIPIDLCEQAKNSDDSLQKNFIERLQRNLTKLQDAVANR